jgi:hypothetical protein
LAAFPRRSKHACIGHASIFASTTPLEALPNDKKYQFLHLLPSRGRNR